MALSDETLKEQVRGIIKRGWIDIPDTYGLRGTGAPGIFLEMLLGIEGGNLDIPDAGKWELKFHGGTALITLFHLEAEPKGHLHHIVRKFGWKDDKGRTSFRHTIRGRSNRGFFVRNSNSRITICHESAREEEMPYWTHDHLINALVSKLRRLLVVKGRKRNRGSQVRYESAAFYQELMPTRFFDCIERGVVAIDFDVRTKNGSGLRNHGTKFRVAHDDLRRLYSKRDELN